MGEQIRQGIEVPPFYDMIKKHLRACWEGLKGRIDIHFFYI